MTSPAGNDRPATVRLWSLTEDVLVESSTGGSLVVLTRWGEFDLPDAGPFVRESLRRMSLGPVTLGNVPADGGRSKEFRKLDQVLDELCGSVTHSVGLPDGQAPLLSATPLVPMTGFDPRPVEPDRPIRLSRFATFRPVERELWLESPSADYRLVLHHRTAVLVTTALAGTSCVADVARGTGLPEPVVADLAGYCAAAGIVLLGDETGRFAEDADERLGQWAHHELLFHVRSRTRREEPPPLLTGVEAPGPEPSLVKTMRGGRRFDLHRPDTTVVTEWPSLSELLERDHECPEMSPAPLRAEELGELLFRGARVRAVQPANLNSQVSHLTSQRPYFNIACLYELELYLTVDRCAGLPRAIYHYDPMRHALTTVTDDDAAIGQLLDMAKVAARSARRPPVLITMTARMERTSWAFDGAAYATTLMHVGALQQTLYLTAKAMGLSAHAVTVDAGSEVDQTLGLPWPAEVAVGECVLDSRS